MSATGSDTVVQTAAGALAAQELIAEVRDGACGTGSGWLRYAELAARHGGHSPAARSFVVELTKHAST